MNCLPVLVVLLLTVTAQVAGDCSVYDTPQSSSTDRCRQVQECIDDAFFVNENNRYYLNRIFRSTQSRTPVALIVNYHVIGPQNGKANDSDLGVSANGSGSGSGFGSTDESNEMPMKTEVNTSSFETANYTEEIGWSTTGIYKAIRPEVLIALQPAWYWYTLGFAIDNYSFPRSLDLVIDVTKCTNSLADITRSEVREALEHLTMRLNYNVTGELAYICNTDTNSLQKEEINLFMIILLLGIFLFVPLTLLLPKLYRTHSKMLKNSWAAGIFYLIFEGIFHYNFRKHYLERDLYSNIQITLECVIIVVGLFGVLYGLAIARYHGKHLGWCLNFCSLYIFVVFFAAYPLPMLIEAFIYPTEIISAIGFIMILIAIFSAICTIQIIRYTRLIGSNSKSITILSTWSHLQLLLLVICLYHSYSIVYALLVLYLSLLKLLLESPISQLFQLILIILPIIVGIGSFILRNKLGSKMKPKQPKENTDSKLNRDNSERINEEDDQTQDSINTREQNQPESRQLQKRVRVATQLRDRQQTPQESSREIRVQVEVEPNQEDTDNMDESIV